MPLDIGTVKTATSFAYFRDAVKGARGAYTEYKYIEGSSSWYVYSDLSPGVSINYTITKESAEETTFLAEKATVDAAVLRYRMETTTVYEAHKSQHESDGGDKITHDSLFGAGSNSHAQVDAHVASTSNPHSVTAAQATAAPTPHAIDGSDHSGQLSHASLTNITVNSHHNQVHTISGSDHTGSLAHSSLSGVGATDHHSNANDPTAAQKAALNAATGLSGSNRVAAISDVDDALDGRYWRDPVLDKDLTAPPGSPSTGDRYLIYGTGTGDWAGHTGEIAQWNGSSWDFNTPSANWCAKVSDESTEYTQRATESPWVWVESGGSTAIHGNEKHSPDMLTVGGNRSDTNLNALTGGGQTSLHSHTSSIPSGCKLVDSISIFNQQNCENVNNNTWHVVGKIPFKKDHYSVTGFTTIYNFCAVMGANNAGAAVECRIYDRTNDEAIGTTTLTHSGLGDSVQATEDLAISDFNTGWIILEAQIRRSTGTGSAAGYCYSVGLDIVVEKD